jgi:aminoglycoside phosphotransferase (APT) family kinase protein
VTQAAATQHIPQTGTAVPEAVLRPKQETRALPIDALRDYLASVGLHMDITAEIRQFGGGLANLNFLIHVDGKPIVLRRPPGGELPKGAHDMGREFRILSRLCKALPFIPQGIHYCEDLAVLGVKFQLIEYRPGLVLRGTDLPFPERAAALGEMLVTTLAQIHTVDPASIGLEQLGKPEGFFERGIAGWQGRGAGLVEGATEPLLLAETTAWLAAQRLSWHHTSLLHCDFKLDNCILDPVTLQPNAVIDWDMGTRGNPLFDLATMLSYWTEAGDPPCMQRLQQMPTAAAGFQRREEILARYAQLTGFDVSDYPVWRVLALLKLSVVFLQLHDTWRKGGTGDARYAEFRKLGAELLEYTHAVMRGQTA